MQVSSAVYVHKHCLYAIKLCVFMCVNVTVNCPVKQNCSRPVAAPGNHFQMVLIAGCYPTHCGRSDCRKLENFPIDTSHGAILLWVLSTPVR